MHKKILILLNAYLPPFLWASVIFLFSSQSQLPGLSVSMFDFFFKKSAHMFVYAVFYFLLHRGINFHRYAHLPISQRPHFVTNWWLPFLFTLLYAALDEFHQMFTPNRYPTIRDVGYDMLGAWVSFLWIYRYI